MPGYNRITIQQTSEVYKMKVSALFLFLALAACNSKQVIGDSKCSEKAEPITVVEEKASFVIDEFGNKFWRNKNGEFHREGGPAAEFADGYKKWYLNGKLHRKGGPAVEFVDGGKVWYLNGELHRVDGPAVDLANGDKEWWLHGVRL